jgi:hypothetical protein
MAVAGGDGLDQSVNVGLIDADQPVADAVCAERAGGDVPADRPRIQADPRRGRPDRDQLLWSHD